MDEAFLGEVRLFAGSFAPMNWAFCDGASMSISGNDALYLLIGTTYGGDGTSTFNLPDLRGRVPIHQGPDHPIGEVGDLEFATVGGNDERQALQPGLSLNYIICMSGIWPSMP